MKDAVLVRNGRHMRPLLAVLLRYGIGLHDKYDRGLWISETDLPRIKEHMASDPTGHDVMWNGKAFRFVRGTNIHNDVQFSDFNELFRLAELRR